MKSSSQDGAPNAVDVHVGAKVRLRRKTNRVSQADLAEALGLTFQQVQKYERGANRISASKLWAISRFLGVPIEHFFEDLPTEGAKENPVVDLAKSPDAIRVMRALARVQDVAVRRKIVELVEAMAE